MAALGFGGATDATGILPYPNPQSSLQYADDVLAGLKAPLTATNVRVETAFIDAETPTFVGFNGMGTTLATTGPAGPSSPNPANPNVQDYPNVFQGVQAQDVMLAGGPYQYVNSSGDVATGNQTALAPQYVKDLRSGTASQSTLINDIYQSNWDGSPDTYDSGAVATILGDHQPLAKPGSAETTPTQDQATSGSTTGGVATGAELDSWWNPYSWAVAVEHGVEKVLQEDPFTVPNIASGASGSVGSDIRGGIVAGAVGLVQALDLPQLVIRGLEIVGGGILMGLGIVLLVGALSKSDTPGAPGLGPEIAGAAKVLAA